MPFLQVDWPSTDHFLCTKFCCMLSRYLETNKITPNLLSPSFILFLSRYKFITGFYSEEELECVRIHDIWTKASYSLICFFEPLLPRLCFTFFWEGPADEAGRERPLLADEDTGTAQSNSSSGLSTISTEEEELSSSSTSNSEGTSDVACVVIYKMGQFSIYMCNDFLVPIVVLI